MDMKETKVPAIVTLASVGFLVALAVTFVATPSSMASSPSQPSTSYPIEIMRAHANYIVADPAPSAQVGLGVRGDR
jgi:hypothetical protein